MKDNFKKILNELSYRVSSGIPDLSNEQHLMKLWDILKEHKWSIDARVELLKNISGQPVKYDVEKDTLTKEQFIEMCIGIGDILTEASVHDDKYPMGHKVMFGSAGEKSFQSKLPKGEPMIVMPAEKTKPTEDAIPIFQKDSGVEYYLKGSNGKVYHIKGSASAVSSWFKHYKDNTTFSLDTTHKETASLLGVYLDAGSYLKRFNEANDETLPKIVTDFKNEVSSVLSGQDWVSNNLVSMMSKASIANIIQVCAIAAGMDRFCKQKGAKNWNIVHNQIKTYYKAEIKNPFTKTEGGKENTADWVANLFPLDDLDNVHIFDETYAVGASLGHPPVASNGMITYMDDEIDSYKYWMSSAPTIFGNSGGAVYRWSDSRKQYEYIGVPSRISIQPMGFSADAITHMGYFIPIERVYKLLEENDYQFIYDEKVSIEDCQKARDKKQKPEKDDD